MKGAIYMNNSKRLSAAVIAVCTVLSSAVSCSSKKKDSSNKQPVTEAQTSDDNNDILGSDAEPSENMEITWLADFDLNPVEGEQRSVALSLFEDVYGGKINYVYAAPEEKYSTLSAMIDSGETVDMFPYEAGIFPDGVLRGYFAPLDPYFEELGMDSGIWDEMSPVTDMLAYNGQHYVMPYSISDPVLVTYSRKLMQSEGIDDPRKLWQEGKWDWNAMKSMTEKFRANNPDASRYGINGWYGQAAINSTGHTVVGFDGSALKNNIADPEVAKAIGLINDVSANSWYNGTYHDTFPSDFNSLFFVSGSWTLGISNAANPEADLMIVPFPKSPDTDKNYVSCNFNSRLLVNGSDKGSAVAAYLRCERLAASETKYKNAAKAEATAVRKNQSGSFRSFITEEQYDALMEYTDLSKVTPVLEFGNGMEKSMADNVMSRITDTSREKDWEAEKKELSPAIDAEIAKYNS